MGYDQAAESRKLAVHYQRVARVVGWQQLEALLNHLKLRMCSGGCLVLAADLLHNGV